MKHKLYGKLVDEPWKDKDDVKETKQCSFRMRVGMFPLIIWAFLLIAFDRICAMNTDKAILVAIMMVVFDFKDSQTVKLSNILRSTTIIMSEIGYS